MKHFVMYLLAFLICLQTINANNVQISNVQVLNNGGDVKVKFDISWENSWRVNTGQNNYDGVWVFFKYRIQGTTDWQHLYLSGIAANNSMPAGSAAFQINPSGVALPTGNISACQGAIIYRSQTGFGNVSFANVVLDAMDNVPYDIDVRAFGLEMVYLPPLLNQNSGLYLGDGAAANAFHALWSAAPYFNNFSLPDGAVIGTDANLTNDDDYLAGRNGKTLTLLDQGWKNSDGASNTEWPTSQWAWCMKYELSHGAYRDFLNTLTVQQQQQLTAVSPASPRGTLAMNPPAWHKALIKIDTPANGAVPAVYGMDANNNNVYNETSDGEYIAFPYLSWPDLAAYLDWSGLSPMTEVVYERACRGFTNAGPNRAIANEYAWGNSNCITGRIVVANENSAAEALATPYDLTNTLGEANYNAVSPVNAPYTSGMPLRNGFFALPNSNRVNSGAAFFGVMEMSGNLSEICVTLGNNAGRVFRGWHGDGRLERHGYADVGSWPGLSQGFVTTSAGTILRGGNYFSPLAELQVSDRSQGQARDRTWGIQGGRGCLYQY